ncbi:MAG: AAA family ATPase [Tannerellaceae bacterium]|jgi:DNA transposition AAA+ family ATPase|nr:AAA family ATPase [Tannerellaceae bacterium]
MTTGTKAAVIFALQDYIGVHGLTQEEIALKAGVNVSYINAMLNNSLKVGKTDIGDKHFRKVASAIGFMYETYYWEQTDTPQYEMIMEELLDAKVRGLEKMIIGDTGTGKTYTMRQFQRKHPANTYCITVSSMHQLGHILSDICDEMGIQRVTDNMSKLRKISARLKNIRLEGKQPIIVIDEAENLKLPALKMTKALYDALYGYCPIVLIGTHQLLRKLEQLKESDTEGMAQLYRRFKAGKREIRGIDKGSMFEPFLSEVDDEGVRALVCTLADNYGELNRYLEPALREADQMKEPLTEQFYRMLYKI